MNTQIGKKISVCLLTYNHAEVIESTLKSILDQTINGYEIIISDDCSTDGTWEKILEFAKNDLRIKPIQTSYNLGMPGNANFAVEQSIRPYIALLHHDDLYRRDLLEKWAGIFDRFPNATFVFNSYITQNGERHFLKELSDEQLNGRYFLEQFLFKNWGCPVRGTAMIRRSHWNAIGGMREQFNLLADVDMWMRLARLGSVGYVAEDLIIRRAQRPDYYPEEYKEEVWSWRRRKFLYEIHAINRLDYLKLNTFFGQLQWWNFRLKISCDGLKWLTYAIVRKKYKMITSSYDGATKYDLWPLILYRILLNLIYKNKELKR
jgi:glycosyltransferase involved in cell wall biosynthesis